MKGRREARSSGSRAILLGAQAKRLAAREKISVSAMFARFVRAASRKESAAIEVPPDSLAARMRGSARLPKGKTDREVLTEALRGKYGVKP